ncbi:MAG: 16S rRNA (guanine(527)-N(7))-methyltransferase RsmG [Myxococcales bacterium]|nr:16S rRNA (guanine(527)-N(7))-methyltransferase RsmG [Myxococcales bacterium]
MTKDQRAPLALPPSAPLAVPDGFGARLDALGASVSEACLAQLGDYLGRLFAMNEQMNLTAITDPESAWERHILDALTLLPLLPRLPDVPAGGSLLDIGSGGGIPGIPLAIARPDLHITLVEATQKKASFLSAVSAAMGLSNVSVRAERAESLVRGELHSAFDVVTARAVARLITLAPLTLPFARPGGLVLLIKGQRADEELAEASTVLRKQRAAHERTVATPTGRIVVLRRNASA